MPRGRPKTDGETKEWDIRLTPVDQEEIKFDEIIDDFAQLLVCKEGSPNGTPRLHYHMYAKTTRSDSYIDRLLNKLGRSDETHKGNAVFSKRKAHEGTIGYVIKGGDVVNRHQFTQQMIDEFYELSKQYRTNKENERKTASRVKEKFLSLIMKEVVEIVRTDRLSTPQSIMSLFLRKYRDNNMRFPNRSTLENATMTILYDINPRIVEDFYSKNILVF